MFAVESHAPAETARTRPFRAGESSIEGGIFGGPTAVPSTRSNIQSTAPRNTVQTDLFGGHAGWGTEEVASKRLDPSAMDAAGSKKQLGGEDARAALTERHDPNKSSINGGIFGGTANSDQLRPKMDRNRSSIPGGIFG
mmetsp:Transcript_31568/g.52231  ORF Transcript_31568/g.52231 Transcript_31568/m.52231 type:complete len:139 (-) Transcript_31568:190-606(-)